MVHLFAEEALIAYIRWRSIQNTSSNDVRHSGANKQFAEKEYYNQKRLARARMQNFNVDQAYRAGRRHFKQAPKM
jgi:predicted molibdopterin-dependent oxidoreductase YjgC